MNKERKIEEEKLEALEKKVININSKKTIFFQEKEDNKKKKPEENETMLPQIKSEHKIKVKVNNIYGNRGLQMQTKPKKKKN